LRAADVRLSGLGAILVIALAVPFVHPPGLWMEPASVPAQARVVVPAVLLGIFPVAAFLFLVASGWFGYASARRSDWVALLPLLVALADREVLTLHSVQEIESYLARGPIGRQSVVYPLFQMFFWPFTTDEQSFTFHVNGIAGALACLPLYLFVRQRTQSEVAAFLCALAFALHPIVARFAPTDGPYSLLFLTWFSGLAFLSDPNPAGRSVAAGVLCLALAAATRVEGPLFVIGSVFMLGPLAVVRMARRFPVGAVIGLAGAAVVGVAQILLVYRVFLGPNPTLLPIFRVTPEVLGLNVLGGRIADPWVPLPMSQETLPAVGVPPISERITDISASSVLIVIAAVVGLFNRRLRVGLGAVLATALAVWPVWNSGTMLISLHRVVPATALQSIAAGLGLYAILIPLKWATRIGWLPAVAGAVLLMLGWFPSRGLLTQRLFFNEEYDVVRSHLQPHGIPVPGCTLLTFLDQKADVDIHGYGTVVPGVPVLDCALDDCFAETRGLSCRYYMRSTSCYVDDSQSSAAPCRHDVGDPRGDDGPCLSEPCAAFENRLRLDPVDLRVVNTTGAFRAGLYPRSPRVGLFKVRDVY
jgi:hypothetical protein